MGRTFDLRYQNQFNHHRHEVTFNFLSQPTTNIVSPFNIQSGDVPNFIPQLSPNTINLQPTSSPNFIPQPASNTITLQSTTSIYTQPDHSTPTFITNIHPGHNDSPPPAQAFVAHNKGSHAQPSLNNTVATPSTLQDKF